MRRNFHRKFSTIEVQYSDKGTQWRGEEREAGTMEKKSRDKWESDQERTNQQTNNEEKKITKDRQNKRINKERKQ